MSALRVVTVDDEALALRRLKLLLNSMPHIEHVAEASSCREALTLIGSHLPDVVLLDVKMRDGTAFDVVDALGAQTDPPTVIFATAFDHFAVRAFESAVADYLLKPIERDRLSAALARARDRRITEHKAQRVSDMQEIVRNLRSLVSGERADRYETEFWLRGSSGLQRVTVDAIDYVSSEDEYIGIHTAGALHLMRGSIRQFEEKVEPGTFVRVHRRWLVRQKSIVELRTSRGRRPEVVLRDGKRLAAGRVYLKKLRAQLRANS